jgi:hypothetical protein
MDCGFTGDRRGTWWGCGFDCQSVVGIATGVQDSFSWKGVALSAIGGGISGGFGRIDFTGTALSSTSNMIVRAAVGSALSQGIAVATGLQDKFSWRAVASSAVGAGVGAAVSGDMGNPTSFATRAASSFAAGATTAITRGGLVSAIQVAADAFGNALGESIAGNMSSAGTTAPTSQGVGPYSDHDYVNDMDQRSDTANLAQRNAAYEQQVLGVFGGHFSAERYRGVEVAQISVSVRATRVD